MELSLADIALAALAGGLAGGAYLGLLWASVRSLAPGGAGALAYAAFTLARIALVLTALAAAGLTGVPASAMAAALAGFIAVRVVATRRLRRPRPEARQWS
jgi:F1F0 ATPase subunit 2